MKYVFYIIILILTICLGYLIFDIFIYKKNTLEFFGEEEEESQPENTENNQKSYIDTSTNYDEEEYEEEAYSENSANYDEETYSENSANNEEETYSENYSEENNLSSSEERNKILNNAISEERNKILNQSAEEIYLPKPDIQKFRFDNPVPISINVSYNTKQSINDSNIANDDIYTNKGGIEGMTPKLVQQENKAQTQAQTESSNNSTNSNISWNTSSDYYIPGVTNVNQNYNTSSSKESNVSPLMYNKPWSDFQSGDSDN